MKRMICALVILSLPFILAFGGPAPEEEVEKATYPYLIDDFEDGDYDSEPEWYTFDNVVCNAMKNIQLTAGDQDVAALAGDYSLNIKGSTSSWYVGGLGTVLAIDATKYDSFDIDIYGYGEKSGRLKIELYDDDNGNKEIEVDKNWIPTDDDLFAYEIEVTWKGWKHISIPFSSLTLMNKGRGDGEFNPNLKGGSGGLVKVQLICVAFSEIGSIGYNVDNLELGVKE